ncbi:hypothetical protein BWD08_03400 [Neisseria animaloris]|nr:hypothetical protein BWD08_03400 [Neisseria animaloris]
MCKPLKRQQNRFRTICTVCGLLPCIKNVLINYISCIRVLFDYGYKYKKKNACNMLQAFFFRND